MTPDEIRSLCKRWQDAVVQRDLPTLTHVYAEAVVLESPMAGTVVGREAVIKATASLFAVFPDPVAEAEPPLVDGDRAAIAVEFSGSHVGSFMGLPPMDKPFRFRIVFLLDVRDGEIVRDRRVYDFTGLMVQLGVLRARPV